MVRALRICDIADAVVSTGPQSGAADFAIRASSRA